MMITDAMRIVATTSTGEKMFGRISPHMIRHDGQPSARAAST